MKSKIYIFIIFFIFSTISSLPLIKIPISTSARGIVRASQENIPIVSFQNKYLRQSYQLNMFYYIFTPSSSNNYTILEKIKYLISSLFLYFSLAIVSIIIIILVDKFVTEILHQASISKLFTEARKNIDDHQLWKIILWVPLIEELLFRLPLKYSKWNFSAFIGVIIYLILKSFSPLDMFANIIIAIICTLIVRLILPYNTSIAKVLENKTTIIISILLFGIIHIFNIDTINPHLFWLYPIYVLPQFFMGYFITNLRIKLGFIWGFSLHAFINLIGSAHLIF